MKRLLALLIFAIFFLVLFQSAYAVAGYNNIINNETKQCVILTVGGEVCHWCYAHSPLPDGWISLGIGAPEPCPEGYTEVNPDDVGISVDCMSPCNSNCGYRFEDCPSHFMAPIAIVLVGILVAAFYLIKKRKR